MSLFAQAQITPYGSVRGGYWFSLYDEDHRLGERTVNDFHLQSNSRFGVNFRNEGLTARAEFAVNGRNNSNSNAITTRLLWARQQFDGWSILVGQDNDGTNLYTNQTWNHDFNLIGYGVVDGSRHMMVRFRLDNGLYIAAMPAVTGNDPANNATGIDALVPRLNIGYDVKLMDNNLTLNPTFVFQTYGYNDDFGNEHDGDITSWLLSATASYKMDALTLTGNFNFGCNTGNMGYRFGAGAGPGRNANPNRATWNAAKNETEDATTLGGYLMAEYVVKPTLNFNLGFGYAATSHDDFDNDATRTGFYLQSTIRAQRLRFIPEFGIMMDGDSVMNDEAGKKVSLGSMTYFGTQLRFDF